MRKSLLMFVGLAISAAALPAVSQAASFQGLGFLPGQSLSEAFGVSADSSAVVGDAVSATTNVEAFRWTSAGGMVGLGFLPGQSSSSASGASADGSVVVGTGCVEQCTGNNGQASRWTSAGGMVGLGFLPGTNVSGASGVSTDGSVVVGVSGPLGLGPQAFRWTASGGMVGLGFLPGEDTSRAFGVSTDGSVVVGSSSSFMGTAPFQAFVWDATHGMRSLQQVLTDDGLNLTGWTLLQANAISADGLTIVGQGTDPGGHEEGWIATIPEPATGLLVSAGVLGLAIARRRTA